MAKNKLLTVEIKSGELRICIGLETLKWALEHAPEPPLQEWDGEDFLTYRVCDIEQFANDVMDELLAEDDDGTTMVHKLLDEAMFKAVENGSLGLEDDMKKVKY